MKLFYFLFTINLIVLFSCKNEYGPGYELQDCLTSSERTRLVLVDTLRLDVDSVTSTQHYYDQFKLIDGTPYYLIFNQSFRVLNFYNLLEKKRSHTINFQEEGPDGINEPHRFYYHNEDSIFFIYYDNFKRLLLLNQLGIRINSWNIEMPEPYESYWISGELFYEFKFDARNKNVGFWVSFGKVDTKPFQKTIKQCRFNLENDSYRFFGDLPNEFHSRNYYPNNYVNGYSAKNHFICYYLPSHEVQVYDELSGQLKKRIKIKSKHLPAEIPSLISATTDPDIQQEYNYNLENGFYVKMFSNEEGTYHYRIVKHPTSLRYADGRIRNFFDKPFSIMLLDSGLNLIDEVVFPGGQYDFYQSFAYSNKLFLSLNNPLNDMSSDNEMIFAVYEVQHY